MIDEFNTEILRDGAVPDTGEGDNFQETTHNFYTGAGYQEKAMRTAKFKDFNFNLNHAAMGLASESGELMSTVKAFYAYNKPLDVPNIIEELGDILWFSALMCETLGITMDEVMSVNIEKLSIRYPDKYTDENALKRADKP